MKTGCAPPDPGEFKGIVEDPLYRKIKHLVGRAIQDFNLIEAGDRICVGMSGGKDSYTLLHLLEALRRRAPVAFTLVAVNIDSGYAGFRADLLERHLRGAGFETAMEKTNAYAIIEEKRDPKAGYCSFCARLRRGFLYTAAARLGCNKVALGHHLDDFVETLLLNQFFSGTLAAMSPKLAADNGIHTVIRPLVYVDEARIVEFSRRNRFPVICCACPVCGTFDQRRQRVKRLVRELATEIPEVRTSLLAALGNVHPGQLLDPRLHDFGTRDNSLAPDPPAC